MNLKPVFIYKIENPKSIKDFCLRVYNTVGLNRIIAILMILVMVFLDSIMASATDTNSDAIDDRLNVALAPAEDMFFPDTGAEITETMAEITFDTGSAATYTSNGVQAALVSNSATTRTIGNGSGTLSLGSALVWGGAGGTGQYAVPGDTDSRYTLRFTNTQRYLGFWWSAGNDDNNLELLDTSGNVITNFTTFTTQSVRNTIFPSGAAVTSCPWPRPTAAQIATTSGLAYCGNPVRDVNDFDSDGNTTEYRFDYVAEPYAFIHLRYADGFGGLRIWGTGFEFDNLTFSETNPAASADEVAVGGGLNTTCTGVGALTNGGFETVPTIAENPSSLTTVDGNQYYLGQWHGYNGGPADSPRQIAYLFEDASSNTPKITGWNTTASDGIIELQRGVTGFLTNENTSLGGAYYDSSGPLPAEGSHHAELSATTNGAALFQDISTVAGSTIRWSLKHRGRTTSPERMFVKIASPTANFTEVAETAPTQRYSPTNSVWDAPTYSSTADSTSGTISISDRLQDGWRLYEGSYTVPVNQTTTRFRFEADGGGSFGNLLDDIQFTPTLACPDTTSIIINRSAINFDPIANDRRPNTGNSITVVSITGSGTATVSGTNLQLSSTTAGTYTVRYRLTNSFGDTSQANLVVTVLAEANPRASNVVLVDPRLSQVTIPDFNFTGSINLKVCIDEWNGSSISAGTPPLKFDVATKSSIQTSGDGSAIIEGDRTGSLRVRHSQTNTESTLNSAGGLTAYLDSGTFSLTRYIRLRTLPISASDSDSPCDNASTSFSSTIEIRPLGIDQIFHKNTIPLKNL